jgi:acyl-CoA thioester hydrolase
MVYAKKVEIRWSDMDPNFHVRHSCYYDWGAYCRIAFMNEYGITPAAMVQYHIGPIIFREECVFKREIKFGDAVEIKLLLQKVSPDYRKWTMLHEIWINGDTLAALLTIDGAWLDTQLRKVTAPPDIFKEGFAAIPHAANFQMD